MATKEEWDFGQRALQKSREKISAILNNWNYERNGAPTPEKLSKLIPMSLNAVYRHYKDFIVEINEININGENLLNEFRLNYERMKKIKEEQDINKKNKNEIDKSI